MANIIAVDIGNTRIALGTFISGALVEIAHHLTTNLKTAQEDIVKRKETLDLDLIAIASVVPSITRSVLKYCKTHGHRPFEVSLSAQKTIVGAYDSLGSDRLANIVAAVRLYSKKETVIVIDLGTATTLTAADSKGNFLGGLICLGLGKTFSALHHYAEQLPELVVSDSNAPLTTLALNTKEAIENGCILGHLGLVEFWIGKCKQSLKENAVVVATGGYTKYIAHRTKTIDHVDANLTLWGINFIAEQAMGLTDQS